MGETGASAVSTAMKWLLGFLALGIAHAIAAFAPASIAGKVYRSAGQSLLVRQRGEQTIVFNADGRFVFLKQAIGGKQNLFNENQVFLPAPPADGTYVYHRTGDNTATIDLTGDDGTKQTLELNFTSENGGGTALTTDIEVSWVLSDLAAAATAPANNLSLRGHVTPGHPLIVGFIVPGTGNENGHFPPPPDARQREVLIRVIGPSLAPFGVTGLWADPDFQIFRGASAVDPIEAHYANWCVAVLSPSVMPNPPPDAGTEAAFRRLFSSPYVGAFPLLSQSKDAAAVVRLTPGAYTIVCNAASGEAGGEALIEVYFLP